jgi:uncharacterized protein (DUF427 family)
MNSADSLSSIVDKSLLTNSTASSTCPWKGKAAYYNINVDGMIPSQPRRRCLIYFIGQVLKDVAWYYPHPKDKAQHIKDYVAFCEFRFDKHRTT